MPDSKPHRRGAFADIPMPARLIIATRKSPLALAQAHIVARALEKFGVHRVLKKITATGDEIIDRPLADIGGKELFVNNLRRALLEGAADIAVHSMKDLPAERSPEFSTIVAGFAEDPRDVFISRRYESLAAMPKGATVGTCSPRRAALLREYFPQIRIVPMRGNVQTRLQKMRDGACDGIILAAAGLHRLNLIGMGPDYPISEVNLNFDYLSPEIFIPAPGQGMLAVECLRKNLDLSDDARTPLTAVYDALSDFESDSLYRNIAESKFVRTIGGDCRTPLGAYAHIDGDDICLRAFYAGNGNFRQSCVHYENGNPGALYAGETAAGAVLQTINNVWVSRPYRRAFDLARALRRHDLADIIKPAMRIVAAKNRHFNQLLSRPRFYDLAIFVSEEAAHRCRNLIAAEKSLPAMAIGDATFAAVEKIAAFAAVRASAGDGDSLLRSPHLRARQIDGKKIAVVGGVSGDDPHSLSPDLCEELRRRGAEVFCAVAYRRIPAPANDADIAALCESGTLRAAVAYSGDTAANMLAMIAPRHRDFFLRSPLFVIHRNIAAAAQKMGFRDVHIAPPDAEKMAAQIAAHLQTRE